MIHIAYKCITYVLSVFIDIDILWFRSSIVILRRFILHHGLRPFTNSCLVMEIQMWYGKRNKKNIAVNLMSMGKSHYTWIIPVLISQLNYTCANKSLELYLCWQVTWHFLCWQATRSAQVLPSHLEEFRWCQNYLASIEAGWLWGHRLVEHRSLSEPGRKLGHKYFRCRTCFAWDQPKQGLQGAGTLH